MSDVSAKLIWQQELAFKGINSNGHEIILDGNKQTGLSPMDALLEATGACSAIDVVVILEKQRTPAARLEVSLAGDRNETEPRYYKSIRLAFDLWGDGLKPEKVERAIRLSLEKYCSVYHSLRKDLLVSAVFRLHAPDAAAEGDWQLVRSES